MWQDLLHKNNIVKLIQKTEAFCKIIILFSLFFALLHVEKVYRMRASHEEHINLCFAKKRKKIRLHMDNDSTKIGAADNFALSLSFTCNFIKSNAPMHV